MVKKGGKPRTGERQDEEHSSYQTKAYRFIGIFLAKKLLRAPLTPNQLSLLRLVTGLIAAFFFALGSHYFLVLGGLFFLISTILDYTDGSLARMRGIASNYGLWFDMIGDSLVYPAAFFGLTYGAFNRLDNPNILVLGFIAALVSQVIIYSSWFCKVFFPAIFEKQKTKATVTKEFYFTPVFIVDVSVLGTVLDMVFPLLVFLAIYGIIFCAGMFILLTLKIRRLQQEFLSKKSPQPH